MELTDIIVFEIFSFLLFSIFMYKLINAFLDDKKNRLSKEVDRLKKQQRYLKGEIYKYHYKK